MKVSISRLIYTVVMLLLTLPASAVETTIEFGYGMRDVEYWGTKKVESYDVAIRIAEPTLVGRQIMGLTVPFASTENLSGFSGWLSKELVVGKNEDGKKVNMPDIVSVSAQPIDNILVVKFAEPYTIPEEGVYVGYSFTVDAIDGTTGSPVAVTPDIHQDGFFLHTSRTYLSWGNYAEAQHHVSAMKVIIAYDQPDNAVAVGAVKEGRAALNETGRLPVEIINYGAQPVTSVDFTYTVDGIDATGHADIEPAIDNVFGMSRTIDLPIMPLSEKGSYDITFAIDKVNGSDNATPSKARGESKINVYAFVPTHRPLMEEYTGLWCGYCPRGYAGLEEMNARYPDEFVAVSYHYDDVMQSLMLSEFPNSVNGFPAAYLDRIFDTDAYCGFGEWGKFGIEKTWKDMADILAKVDISAKAYFDDSDPNIVKVETSLRFIEDMQNINYRLQYILTADDLYDHTGKDANWNQVNYYYGSPEFAGQPGMDIFVNTMNSVSGLHFNDVALSISSYSPDGTVPAEVIEGEVYGSTYKFDISGVMCLKQEFMGDPIIQDVSKLNVIAVIVDAETGYSINSYKAHVKASYADGIASAEADSHVVKTVYYDLAGRQIDKPRHGVYVCRETLANGKTRSRKEAR